MKSYINEHQLHQIVAYIKNNYKTFATQKTDGKVIFDELKKPTDLLIKTPKTVISFKKILWPNGQELKNQNNCHPDQSKGSPKKFAFLGLTNCDAIALNKLLKELDDSNRLPKREDILIVSTTCLKDENCFCTALGYNKIENYDLHIQKEQNGYSIFGATFAGNKILLENGIKNSMQNIKPREIELEKIEPLNMKILNKRISNRSDFEEFWEKISDSCFGCGACSSVCPLCFCTRQDFENKTNGACNRCLNYDSCFAKSFSEIQRHYDFRPKNVDRLYNWYHHKFVRAVDTHKQFLCTGCGRCIKACPAHLNQHRIIESVEKKPINYD